MDSPSSESCLYHPSQILSSTHSHSPVCLQTANWSSGTSHFYLMVACHTSNSVGGIVYPLRFSRIFLEAYSGIFFLQRPSPITYFSTCKITTPRLVVPAFYTCKVDYKLSDRPISALTHKKHCHILGNFLSSPGIFFFVYLSGCTRVCVRSFGAGEFECKEVWKRRKVVRRSCSVVLSMTGKDFVAKFL